MGTMDPRSWTLSDRYGSSVRYVDTTVGRATGGLDIVREMSYGGAMVDITQLGALRGRIPANKGKRYPVEVLTPDEVRALAVRCSKTSSTGLRYRALITLLYRTGLRAAEALALRTKDVDHGSVPRPSWRKADLPAHHINEMANPACRRRDSDTWNGRDELMTNAVMICKTIDNR
jgi:integrase